MYYDIIIKKQAEKKLKDMKSADRDCIADKIYMLGVDLDDLRLDVKKMVGMPYYRLRIGDWRVIYDRRDNIKVISIEKINGRGDVCK